MRSFWLVSTLLIVLLVGCQSYAHRFTRVEATADQFTPDFLKPSGFEHSFRAHIDAYGHTMAGIFIIKKLDTHHYRMALLNEFGGTLMGFELLDDSFILHHAIPPLRRKALLNILEQDFKLLLNEDMPILRQFANADTIVYETNFDGQQVYQYLEPRGGRLAKTTRVRRGRERVNITFDYRDDSFPDLTISHHHGKLNIFLFLLKEAGPQTDSVSP